MMSVFLETVGFAFRVSRTGPGISTQRPLRGTVRFMFDGYELEESALQDPFSTRVTLSSNTYSTFIKP